MTFPTNDILLGPAFFGPRKGSEGIIWHTTESADASRASAVGTAIWQKTNPGSYNFIIYDGGLLLTVPYLEASGGVNPASSAWAPGRFPFLRASLSAAAYADPNAYLLNVAFSGKTAVFRDQGIPVNMIETAVALTRWVEAQPWATPRLVHSGHQHWQSNRSDPSQKVLDLIARLYAPEHDMKFTNPIVTQDWDTVPGAASTFARPDGTAGYFTAAERVKSVAEGTVNGVNSRLLDYGPDHEALTIPRAGLTNPGLRIVGSPIPDAQIAAALDSANKRTATVKSTAATALRLSASADRMNAATAEAAAKNIESL